ncbi:MAG: hypothetical protein ACO3CS_18900, partial [Alphaproteobacteria bacterium]
MGVRRRVGEAQLEAQGRRGPRPRHADRRSAVRLSPRQRRARRVELRFPDAAAHPYLALAA